MRIKRVEIIGFKSFCDRAVVQIGESITGVVGPNGCGKSNIVDAIRWCMGEQSAKHLRGKAMEDVIFAGSESRGPAPMAEVSLTFDDVGFSHEALELARHSDEAETERALDQLAPDQVAADEGEAAEPDAVEAAEPEVPQTVGTWVDAEGNPIASPLDEAAQVLADRPPAINFGHYTEVQITRRLYRDGTSQYFINKTPCRLRDITDFFLGTGVGTKAYAIIEQGRIGQIVSSRPQDRRAIIEEAAGITKFKAKKKAAEKKLEQTRQNLMRVSDIVTELDKRMGTLRRQAQKAERYRKYKAEMRDIELWKAAHRWLELAGEDQLVTGRLTEARDELETARTAWSTKDAHVVAERAELAVEERRLVGVQEHVYELDNRIRLGESKIGFESREADELDGRIAGARTEIEGITGQREQGAQELAARRSELAELEAEVARESAEVSARETATGDARQLLASAQGQLDQARAELGSRRTEIATADAQLEAFGRRRDEAGRRLERVVAEVDQHTERVRELEREGRRVDGALSHLRQTRLDLGSQSSGFEHRKELLADDVARGESEVEALRTELHRRNSRLTSLKEIQDRYEGFQRGTRAVMQRADDIIDGQSDTAAIHGVVADVVRAPEQLEVAVEAALGDRLGGVLVSEPEVGLAAIGFLKQAGGGRSAFVPMTAPIRVAPAVVARKATPASTAAPTPAGATAPSIGPAAERAAAAPSASGLVAGHASPAASHLEPAAGRPAQLEPVFEGEGGAASWMSPAWDPIEPPTGEPAASLSTPSGAVSTSIDSSARAGDASTAIGDASTATGERETLASHGMSTAIAVEVRGGASSEMPEDVREGASSELPIERREGASSEKPHDVGEGASSEMPQQLREGASSEMPQQLREGVSSEMPEDVREGVSSEMPIEVQGDTSSAMPIEVQGDTSSAMPIEARDGAPVEIPTEVQDRTSTAIPIEVDDWLPISSPASGDGRSPASSPSAGDDRGAIRSAIEVDDRGPARSAIEIDDRSELIAAYAAIGGEGVLGRMADLVDFADGYETVGKRLLGATVVVDRLDRALQLHHHGVGDRLVTLDGDIIEHDGVVAGGSRDAQGAGVLAQKREIRDLETIVGELEHDLSEAMARLVTAKMELKQVTKALEGLRTQVHEGEVAIMGHEKDEARVRHDLERHRERLGQLSIERHELDDRLRAIAVDDGATRDRRATAVARIAELERAQLDHLSDVAAHRERLEQLAQILTEARIRAAQLGEKRAAAEASALRLAAMDADLAARAGRLTGEIEDALHRAVGLREGCEQLAAELAVLREERTGLALALEDGRRAYDARLSGLTEVELAARELRVRADQLAREVGQLELRSGQIVMTRQVVEDHVGERYQLAVRAILYDYHLRPRITQIDDDRLTELRELIERMGTDINLTAIEEYAEVSQRFEFLSAQKGDLERAVDQLQRAIDKINKTSRKLFKDTFTAVNTTFKEVFPRLFRGGQAALSLSGGDDVDLLEAGVEIMAQPPGKKNTTVEQLSGGEKALTAVALVFSIFLIKPSPFCILDEVDAPLDEANVDRYNELVREMTDRSQFIVITHNKRTMEAVDNLYGVTMQEPGVSKLVSVNLSKLGGSAVTHASAAVSRGT